MVRASIAKTYLIRTIAVAACALALLGGIWIHFDYKHFVTRSEEIRQAILKDKKRELTARTDGATDYIEFVRNRVQAQTRDTLREQVYEAIEVAQAVLDHTRNKTQAVRQIRAALRTMRFSEGTGYFFAYDMDGDLVLHGETPEAEGEHRLNLRDDQGAYVIKDFIELIAKRDEGYSKYFWAKPGSRGDDHEKISFIRHFKPLNWIIGAGLYTEDIAQQTQQKALEWLGTRDYGDSGYLFAWKFDGTALVGPYVGSNFLLSDDPDEHGPFSKALQIAQNGGGFLTYERPSAVGEPIYQKLSYIKAVEGWDWFIGHGYDTREIESSLARIKEEFRTRITNITLTILIIIACFITAAYAGLQFAVRGVRRDFRVFGEFFSQAAEEASPIDTARLTFKEFELVAKAANHMTEERRKTQKALEQSEARYRRIFENITDGYYRSDLQGRVQFISPSAQRIMGFDSTDEAKGLLTKDLYLHPEKHVEFMNLIIKHGHFEGYTCTMLRKDGAPIELEVNSRLILDEETGAPVAVEGLFRDITERNRTQEILVQTEKMQSVCGLAAGMAHEINNPLGGILQGVQNVERRLSPDLPANVKVAAQVGCDLNALALYLKKRRIPDTLEGIREMGSRAAEIVSRMLAFSRQSESRVVRRRLEEMADKAVDLAYSDYDLKKKFQFRSIDIFKDFDLSLPEISCTETEIEQVILNQLTNAAQAIALADSPPESPRIIIRTRREGDYAALDIEDNGPGMDEETRRQAFEPFFTTREPGVGTGLGLSNAYFIVTAHHGGKLRLLSEPGEGTTFTILLPVAEPSQAKA